MPPPLLSSQHRRKEGAEALSCQRNGLEVAYLSSSELGKRGASASIGGGGEKRNRSPIIDFIMLGDGVLSREKKRGTPAGHRSSEPEKGES